MAQPSYDARGIVLRKTKLGESDLIVTLLAEDGSQIRAVAKGARKPTSSFAVRLELYSVVDCLLAQGRNLDIVKEVRILVSNDAVRRDMEHAAGAAPMAELLDRAIQEGLENERLYPLTKVALDALGRVNVDRIPSICAAHLLKTLAFVGLRPSFHTCVGCGQEVVVERASELSKVSVLGGSSDSLVDFSVTEGGVVCPNCRVNIETIGFSLATLLHCQTLLGSTFASIEELPVDVATSFGALRLCQRWIQEHVGANLKSLNFLFTCGLF